MERASRLLPADDMLALALASACLGEDDARASTIFARLATRYTTREAWTGLAVSRRNLGDIKGAAEAVSRALATSVPDATLTGVADVVVRQLPAPGWCGVTVDGVLDVHVTNNPHRIELEIDGRWRRKLRAGTLALPGTWWRAAHKVGVIADGVHLLGSPLDVRVIRRIEGCVAACDGGLDGWVWHPGDPAIDPMITVSAASGEKLTMIARGETGHVTRTTLLGRPRHFYLTADRLLGMAGPFHVRDGNGADLLGSPLDPTREQRAAAAAANALRAAFPAGAQRSRAIVAGPPLAVPVGIIGPCPPIGSDRRRRLADVVIPVHGGGTTVRTCLESVLATVSAPSRIIVIDDATPDHDLAVELTELARRRRIRLVRHARNRGYPASANAGIRVCATRDVVLLNSDTIVTPSWLERLRAVAYSAPDIGTVTPLSNNGTILNYPRPDESSLMPDAPATMLLARQADRANRGMAVDIPVAVGFCMYLRRDCLDAAGAFRTDVFAQGYGEENDFCLRARNLGWRHVAAPGVFVAHRGAQSFGLAGEALRARNQAVLNRLHPGYEALIIAHLRSDPLARARRRMDQVRWRATRPASRASALIITHNDGGGVEQRIVAACAAHTAAGRRPIVLRPASFPDSAAGVVLGDGPAGGFPNLRFALPAELSTLAKFLRSADLREVELHHLLGHSPAVLELIGLLEVPYDVHVHDYGLICPRITLVGRERRYCGEPAVSVCEACVADLGSVSGETISVAELRQRSGRLLTGARHVITPSDDATVRLCRHLPMVNVRTVPYDDDTETVAMPMLMPVQPGRNSARICVVGAIGVEKGYEILLAGARDAAERDLPLEFVVVGHTIDDARLLDTGRVFVTGEFQPAEAVQMIRAQDAAIAWLPSVWPETWCFTLSEAWRAGLRVVAFDLGAQAERIRRTGRGVLLPLGLPPAAINSALLAAAGLSDYR
jgi:GT2 family glycosyltransferase/glycosyltransferase involved in cell wall biosynthesis